ncbi:MULTISPECIES: tyrosine-protein phosphatase [Pseudomonas]|uniref:Protein-tyrosine-phosphatase n=1 Tax=Pseudomonas plecoglossicida TaxID=70775 RepID=A0ABX4TZE0_PSEDL|nr:MULTISPECIES: tyrosine-protein phosphatase [Pseudomonas]ASD11732.1 protein-tyrosine-phosphatase [Pseudomonas aeruginosa]ELB6583899.1 tyrosine-protein phosphatase [Pseudomonas aeruginosa]ELK4933861.1 tyrosine-protein phosphatase [Pseudomonas aeruginosa]MCL8372168.1 tyrosine-protein phosphatase [Pseudomonas aeruginosa]PLU87681.1 protein-tyrosine-phosphatase [Pseudomonas plecoglossicida]
MSSDTCTRPGPRRVALQGAVNCRDLGGYPAHEGRRVRHGLLFRSDSLAQLTAEDLLTFAALNLRGIYDLRHEHERLALPNHLGDGPLPITHLLGFIPHGASEVIRGVRDRQLTVAGAQAIFLEMYRRLPLEHAERYGQLIRHLLEPDALPALIHCTSGKDRTGFAAAVILLMLGVDRELIVEDYLVTNRYRRDLRTFVGDNADAEVLQVLTGAEAAYLHSAFASIDSHWGGTERFLRDGLRIDAAQQAQLRALLLEN